MEIKNYDICYIDDIVKLYNEECVNEGFYKALSKEEFMLNFNLHQEFDPKGTFICEEQGKVIGIVSSFIRHIEIDDITKPGYICLLLVAKCERNKGIGTSLLNIACAYLKEKGKNKVRFGYTGTINYPWIIPNSIADHAGAPGIRINSNFYFFLFHNGFEVVDEQDAFFLKLSDYQTPKDVLLDRNNLVNENIVIELYDAKKHYGLEQFYRDINAESFERVIKENLTKSKPMPFAVVNINGKIVGWTGAFYNEMSGRAHFDGIVISPAVRGKHVGKALFAYLAEYSKNNGAKFMTFFTGRTNHARYIYQGLGFKIIQSFAIMEKYI